MDKRRSRKPTPHNRIQNEITRLVNEAIEERRAYIARTTCTAWDCENPAYFDLSSVGGVACEVQYVRSQRIYPDISLSVNGELSAIIEIVDTSPPTLEKKMKLLQLGVPTFLVDVHNTTVSRNGFEACSSINMHALCHVHNLLENGSEVAPEGRDLASNWRFVPDSGSGEGQARGSDNIESFSLTWRHNPHPWSGDTTGMSVPLWSSAPGFDKARQKFHRTLDRWLILTSDKYRSRRNFQLALRNPGYVRFRVLLALALPRLTQREQEMLALLRYSERIH